MKQNESKTCLWVGRSCKAAYPPIIRLHPPYLLAYLFPGEQIHLVERVLTPEISDLLRPIKREHPFDDAFGSPWIDSRFWYTARNESSVARRKATCANKNEVPKTAVEWNRFFKS
ncbi:hypothetical protein AVEN_165817-1 [Araneus ventricosus]|uniref:Uncharacterized protein n=1 Tax=Araneus ventricosus TaxID=182803 RepID=A0A4Y2EPX3_ARAVE|nr:hypothetical protein AVEN_165817-1 [Araneus ventricosus]